MQWSPRAGETAALALLGAGLGLAALLLGTTVLDVAGRVLVGAGAVLVLLVAARDLVARPRLAAGPDGLDVRTLGGRTHLPWRQVQVRVRETRRLGLRGRTLELDTASGPEDEGRLVVLGRRDLGADPADVARALRELDPR